MDDLYPAMIERFGEYWVDVHEAARRCGVNQRTVRRWIASKRVESRVEEMPNKSFKWYVSENTLPAETVPLTDIHGISEEKLATLAGLGVRVSAMRNKKTGRVTDLIFEED
ncbi:MAG: hypothetical protein AB7K36_30370 [Chloroflexota bacterium]